MRTLERRSKKALSAPHGGRVRSSRGAKRIAPCTAERGGRVTAGCVTSQERATYGYGSDRIRANRLSRRIRRDVLQGARARRPGAPPFFAAMPPPRARPSPPPPRALGSSCQTSRDHERWRPALTTPPRDPHPPARRTETGASRSTTPPRTPSSACTRTPRWFPTASTPIPSPSPSPRLARPSGPAGSRSSSPKTADPRRQRSCPSSRSDRARNRSSLSTEERNPGFRRRAWDAPFLAATSDAAARNPAERGGRSSAEDAFAASAESHRRVATPPTLSRRS